MDPSIEERPFKRNKQENDADTSDEQNDAFDEENDASDEEEGTKEFVNTGYHTDSFHEEMDVIESIEQVDYTDTSYKEKDIKENIKEGKDLYSYVNSVISSEYKTELRKYLEVRTTERGDIVNETLEARDEALVYENDHIKDKSLSLDQMIKSTKHDLNTAKVLIKELTDEDYLVARNIAKEIQKNGKEQLSLYGEYYNGDLPNDSDDGVKPA
nr:hypothetical protein CFP56_73261 [Quercus suber]